MVKLGAVTAVLQLMVSSLVAATSAPARGGLLPPVPLSPRAGMNLTDVALHFQFSNCTSPDMLPVGCSGVHSFTPLGRGVQVSGKLVHAPTATTAAACESACCGDNTCAVWNFLAARGCWVGSDEQLLRSRRANSTQAWVGGTRDAPTGWSASHCSAYEVQLSRSTDFATVDFALQTLAYCCDGGGDSCRGVSRSKLARFTVTTLAHALTISHLPSLPPSLICSLSHWLARLQT
jgi:hypothetical protein